MNLRSLSARESRLLAVLVAVALVVLADLAVIAPVLSGFADRASEREALLARHAANQRAIAAIPRLRRMAEAQGRGLADFALAAPDAATASDLLRERLQAQIGAAGGDFRGAEDVPARAGHVAARITARLAPGQLATFLAGAQNARPAIVITSLVIGADEALVTGHANQLDVQLEASVPFHPAARG